jgi:hypothetical protein
MSAAEKPRRGLRKPVQMELVGGKPARQRIWEQIRLHREKFVIYTIARRADADDRTVATYLRCLVNGGYVVRLNEADFEVTEFQLVRDTGIEAPRLDRQGNPVTQGMGQEAMWRCLRMLGPTNARQLAGHCAAAGIDVTFHTARTYITALKKAGYLQVIKPAGRSRGQLEVIGLIPRMNTGPRPPMIQRVGVVYDPNLNKVMHADEPEELL